MRARTAVPSYRLKSLRQIAERLNAQGVATARDGKLDPTQVADILKRAG